MSMGRRPCLCLVRRGREGRKWGSLWSRAGLGQLRAGQGRAGQSSWGKNDKEPVVSMPATASKQEWKLQKGVARQTRAVISESAKYWLQKFREQEGIERKKSRKSRLVAGVS